MENNDKGKHKADCKCPPCVHRRAGTGAKEILSIRLDAATKEKLQKLMRLYNRGAADIVGEALQLLARRQGF